MIVLIAGTLHFPAGERDRRLTEIVPLVEQTRAQQGCLHYVWAGDPTSATCVYVFEKWDSVDNLAAHLAGPCYHAMLARLGEFGVSDIDISKYRVDLEEPVYDPQGNPRADFFTG